MTAADERATAGEAAARACGYCREEFDPEGTDRLYCSAKHQKKAADRRRHGHDSSQPPERSLVCPWCGAGFVTRLDNQVFCSADHRRQATVCDRKRGFLTLLAAQVVADQTIDPVEPYPCPRVTGERHWHLRTVRQANRAARTAEASS